MGIVKRAADLAFTFRFIRMLVMKWENWDAYKLGIIDENGKRVRSVQLDTDEKKSAYTPFIRLAANVKRLVGQNKLTSIASALFLIKEDQQLTTKQIEGIIENLNLSRLDFLNEESQWYVLEDNMLSPGTYRLREDKVLNNTWDDIVFSGDKVRIADNSYPVGDMFGLYIYEGTHVRTNQKIYMTAGEILR